MVDIATILNQWEAYGVFDYLLPFLLIFALVYGILDKIKVTGENRGVHAVIAVVVGLLALRMQILQDFFRTVFPRLGVGLAVLLVIVILAGLFMGENKKQWYWGFGAVGVVIAIIIITQSFSDINGLGGGGTWDNYAGLIIGAVLVLALVILVAVSGGSKSEEKAKE